MPLVVLCGLPSSGKTTAAREIEAYFQERTKTVLLTEDDMFGGGETRGTVYTDAEKEKKVLGVFLSKIKRSLDRETVVIADGMCFYTAGVRYQLYQMAKEHRTKHCLGYIPTPVDVARERNSGYSESLFEELSFRFEEPSVSARWDRPCFRFGRDTAAVLEAMEKEILGGTKKQAPGKPRATPAKIEERVDEIVGKINSEGAFPCTADVFGSRIRMEGPVSFFAAKKIKTHLIGLAQFQSIEESGLDVSILETVKTICKETSLL
ncbi:MAG: elongator complex associated protein Kti2 [Amphiamblys sp. WSBS2006]|nr:MAG: elongator complex associated protein Kti2 [Amphiamblys sp. WSBS2006]